LAAVHVDGKWGYIDTVGEMVIEPCFDTPEHAYNIELRGAFEFNQKGFAKVYRGGLRNIVYKLGLSYA
jgi:hypothetical protein